MPPPPPKTPSMWGTPGTTSGQGRSFQVPPARPESVGTSPLRMPEGHSRSATSQEEAEGHMGHSAIGAARRLPMGRSVAVGPCLLRTTPSAREGPPCHRTR